MKIPTELKETTSFQPTVRRTDISFPEPPSAVAPLGGFDSYRIMERLGRGGFGLVYKAFEQRKAQFVAVKILIPNEHIGEDAVGDWAERRERFDNEAHAAQIESDHIVKIFHVGEFESPDWPGTTLPFIEMEFMNGRSLLDRLRQEPLIAPRQTAEWARQIAAGLAAAHRAKVIHRDIKSGNVLLQEVDGPGSNVEGQDASAAALDSGLSNCRAKVTDFGLARSTIADSERVTRTGQFLGTPGYASPEQLAGAEADFRSDIYSVGVVLYEMLTRTLPVVGNIHQIRQRISEHDPVTPRRLNSEIPLDLETITLKCLRREPDRRYQTASELEEDLQRFLRAEPIRARRVSRTEKAWLWSRRHPMEAILYASLTMAIVVGLIAVFVQWNRAEHGWAKASEEGKRADRNFTQSYTAFLETAEAQQNIAAKSNNATTQKEAAKATRRVIEILSSLLQETPDRIDLRQKLAENYQILGDTLARQGKIDDALTAFQHAKDQWHELLQTAPDNLDYQLGVHSAQLSIASHLKLEDSLYQLGELRVTLERATSTFEKSPPFWGLLSGVYMNSANRVDQQGDFQLAIDLYNKSFEAFDRSGKLDFDNPSVKLNQSTTWNNLALVYRRIGKLEDAVKAHSEASSIIEALIKDDPINKDYLNARARNSNNLGRVYEANGKLEAAEAEFRRGIEARELVHRIDQSDATIVRDLCNNYLQLARVLIHQGQVELGLSLYVRARDLLQPLVDSNSSDLILRYRLAQLYSEWGVAQLQTGQLDSAGQSLENAVQEYEAIHKINPTDDRTALTLAGACGDLASVYELKGDTERSFELNNRTLEMTLELVARSPENTGAQRILATTHESLGRAYLLRKSLEQALAEHTRSRDIRVKLLTINPDDAQARESLVTSLCNIGETQLNIGSDIQGALNTFRDALQIAAELVEQHPNDARFWFMTGICRANSARAMALLGKDEEARAEFREAGIHLSAAVEKVPQMADYRRELNIYLTDFATFEQKQGRVTEANDLLLRREKLNHVDHR